MPFHLLSLILAGILSFVDYVTEHVFSESIRKNAKLVSFSAGVAIAYIILNLFPEISTFALIDGKRIFLYALLGFVSLNLIEQYARKGFKIKSPISYHRNIHLAYFFAYNFFIGIVLVNFALKGLAHTLLFFVPFLLYIVVEILPKEFGFKSGIFKVFYSMAPLFGAFAAIIYTDFAISAFGELVAFITGTLLYIVIRESLPSDKAEKPLYFMLGVLFYSLVIYASWI